MPLPRHAHPAPLRRLARTAPPRPTTQAPTSPHPPRSFRLVLGAGLALFGLIFTAAGWNVRSTSRAAAAWPTVQGTVERSGVVSREERGDRGRNGGTTRIMYAADVVYTYAVDGRPYKSAKIAPVQSWNSSENDALETVSRYSKNAPVTVHYNPKEPSQAFLQPDAGGAPWIFIAAGIVILLIGGAILHGVFRPGA